jgi:hypothetical protein
MLFDKQWCVHRSKTCCQTLKHFDNVFATGGNNIGEVFESLKPFGKFLLIALVIVRITLNVIVRQMPLNVC